MLVQLANTPPPPENLARGVVRRLKIWTPIALVLATSSWPCRRCAPCPT
ncbi:hypothetical protein [Streptomyces sp. x-19]